MLSVKLDISLDELFADELVYLKRGKVEVFELDKYPGMVDGLKLLAEKIETILAPKMEGTSWAKRKRH